MSRTAAGLLVLAALFAAVSCTDSGDSATEPSGNGEVDEAAGQDDPAGESATGANDLTVAGGSGPGDGITVVASRSTWSIGYLQSAVIVRLLEALGYTVTNPAANELPPGNGYVAMAEGDIDYWPSGLYPAHSRWWEAQLTDGTSVGDHLEVVGALLPASGLEGLLITKAVADEFAITSLAQLNDDPVLVALFDEDGNGKAEVFGCPAEWTCDDVLDATIERNGWSNIEQVKGPFDAALAQSIQKVNDGKPVIQYGWSPSSHLAQLIPGDNVVWLSLGSEDAVCDGIPPCLETWDFRAGASAEIGPACSQPSCVTGWEIGDILVTANTDFLEANPAAAALLAVVTIDLADLVAFGVRYNAGESTEADIRAMADEWIAEHRDLIDGWLATAVAAAE